MANPEYPLSAHEAAEIDFALRMGAKVTILK